jgi:hypothetical protein
MALSIFNSSAGSNYLAGFQPVGPVAKFSEINSDAFQRVLGMIPAKNAEMQAELAKVSISERGAANRQKMVIDAEKDAAEKLSKRNRALNLAQGFAGMFGGGMMGGGGNTNALLMNGEKALSPLELEQMRIQQGINRRAEVRDITQRSREVAAEIFGG